MKLVQNWWKVILANIIWLGGLISIIGFVSPYMAELGAGLLSTICIVLTMTIFGKQTQALNMWIHKIIVGKEPTFFGKSREEIEDERKQVKELILGGDKHETNGKTGQ